MLDAPRGLETSAAEASPSAASSPTAAAVPPADVTSETSPSAKPAYPPAAAVPTQTGPLGIRYDFNLGARVLLPQRSDGSSWRIRLRDQDSGNILFESENGGAFVNSSKRWYVRHRIEVWDGTGSADPVLRHEYDARDRDVLIQFPVGTLGDTLAWMPYAARFAERHGARVTCAMSGLIIPILRGAYPHIRFVTHEELVERALAGTFYATYSLGLFFDDRDCVWQPTDFRQVGLHRTASFILGVDPAEEPARIALADDTRPLAEPYACIAVQASTQAKMWNNPHGWAAAIAALKQRGLRVVCIDQKPVHGAGMVWTHIPHGAEDQTGDRPLAERARWLRHAAVFVGLSSGLAWLAWSAGCPTVLISGFTHPDNEFRTTGRVINWHACNACWNDPRERFDHKDHLWCPRHAGTARQFECTRLITADAVCAAIDRVLAAVPPTHATAPHGDCPPGAIA